MILTDKQMEVLISAFTKKVEDLETTVTFLEIDNRNLKEQLESAKKEGKQDEQSL